MYNWSRPLRALFVAGVDEDHPCPFFPSCSQSAAHGNCWPSFSTATPEASSVRCTASGDLHVDAHSLTVPLAHGSPEPPDHAPFRLPPPPSPPSPPSPRRPPSPSPECVALWPEPHSIHRNCGCSPRLSVHTPDGHHLPSPHRAASEAMLWPSLTPVTQGATRL